ncbi:MAG: VOC family protein [Gammaproteobacteria bacterium]|nr:MAG: VOC family protein [Gammaproteobacteria bacterium]
MLKGFHHAAISTPDLDRLIEFYCGLLGCELAWTFGWDRGSGEADALTGLQESAARAAMLRLGDSHLELFEFSSPPPLPRAGERAVNAYGISHICIEVQDLQGEYARLSAAGMRFHCPPLAQDSGYVAYGRDPDGNVVELLEFTAG